MLSPASLNISVFKKSLVWLIFQKCLLLSASSVLYSSTLEREVSTSFRGHSYSVIPNYSDSSDWSFRQDEESRPSLSYKQIVFLGRLHPIKNIEELLYEWSNLPAVRTGWRLLLVGPDENNYSKRLVRIISECGIVGSVSILPPVTSAEKYKLLDSSSFLILPSLSENFGNVVPESLSRGLPVIASTHTPWAGLQAEGCGYVFEPGSGALRQTLINCLNTPFLSYCEMSASARRVYDQNYSCDSLSSLYLDFYNDIAL